MKLGELFVDLGVNSGGALSSLSSFAFKFNQLAELAKTLTSAVDNMFGTTPQYAHNMTLFSQSTDVAKKSIQGMMIVAKESGGSIDDMISKIQKYDDEVFQMKIGKGNLAERLGLLGLDVNDVLKAKSGIDVISAVIKQADSISSKRDKEAFLRMEGFTTQQANIWREYLKNRAKYDNDRRILTKDEIKNLDTIWKIQQRLGNERRMALDKLRAQNAGRIVQWETKLNNIMMAFDDLVYGDKSLGVFAQDIARNLGVSEEHIENVYDFFKKTKEVADDFTKSQFWDLSKEFTKGFIEGLSALGEGVGRLFYVLAHPKDFDSFTDMADFIKNGEVYKRFRNNNLLSSALSGSDEMRFLSAIKNPNMTDIRSLGLSNTEIGMKNKVPFIATSDIGKLQKLNDLAKEWGLKVRLTQSAGGEGHQDTPRGHYSGHKQDVLFIDDNGNVVWLNKKQENLLKSLGFWGKGTGALGREPDHYDLSTMGSILEGKVSESKPVQYVTLNSEWNITTNDSGIVGAVTNAINQNMNNLGSFVWGNQ